MFDATLVNGSIITKNQLLLSSTHRQCMKIRDIVINETGLTIAVWFKVSSSIKNYMPIASFGNGIINQDYIFIGLFPHVVFVFVVVNTVPYSLVTPIDTTVNSWHHFAWEMIPTGTLEMIPTGTWTLYVDGQVSIQDTFKPYPPQITRSVNYLGFTGFAAGYFNGSLRDFRVYNHSLSAGDVKLLSATTPV